MLVDRFLPKASIIYQDYLNTNTIESCNKVVTIIYGFHSGLIQHHNSYNSNVTKNYVRKEIFISSISLFQRKLKSPVQLLIAQNNNNVQCKVNLVVNLFGGFDKQSRGFGTSLN